MSSGVNYVYNGSNDSAMISMQHEAAVQGFTPAVWMCSISCYTGEVQELLRHGRHPLRDAVPAVRGQGVGPRCFDNYLDHVTTPDSFGAMAWQAAVLFQQAVNDVVESKGTNGITRASLLEALSAITSFDANGWIGAKNPKGGTNGTSDCTVRIKEMENGELRAGSLHREGHLRLQPVLRRPGRARSEGRSGRHDRVITDITVEGLGPPPPGGRSSVASWLSAPIGVL